MRRRDDPRIIEPEQQEVNQAARNDPSMQALLNAALEVHRAGDYREAISRYEHLLSVAPDNAVAHNNLASAYRSTGEFNEAIEHFKKALELKPDYAEACNNLGNLYRSTDRLDDAVASYRRAIALTDGYVHAYANLGNTLLRMSKVDGTAGWFERALQIKPDYVPALLGLAVVRKLQGDSNAAIELFERAIALQPGNAEAQFKLGNLYAELGRNREAIPHFRQAAQIQPAIVDTHNNLGNAYNALGRREAAIPCYRKAIELKPDYATPYNNLGVTLKKLGRPEEAVPLFKKAIALKPDYSEAYNNLGNALKDLGRGEHAIQFFEKATAINPQLAEAHNNLALIYQKLNRIEKAFEHSRQALAINPDYAEAHNNLGLAHQMLGENDQARACYEKALQLKPGFGPANRHLIKLDPEGIAPERIMQLLENPNVVDEDAVQFCFALGEIFNSRKDYGQAFAWFKRGNDIKHRSQRFDRQRLMEQTDRLLRVFSRALIAEKSAHGLDTRTPIFIVGMPRSGTTLVEQILSSHPDVFGAGELGYMTSGEKLLQRRLGGKTPYPECVPEADAANIRRLAEDYMHKIRKEHSADARFVTDKMPDNFLRIGLIKILFPNAPVIHCRRNAMDTCNSIYFQIFVSEHPYAYDLTALGQYYLEYERIMTHWRSLLGDDLFEIQYEELVADQEMHSRRMLEFVGLDWDDRCLAFHEHKRAILTASNQQVRQPIYKDSVARWKRYSDGLQPLCEVLSQGGLDI